MQWLQTNRADNLADNQFVVSYG